MSAVTKRIILEPARLVGTVVVLIHVMAGLGFWFLPVLWQKISGWQSEPRPETPRRYWFDPADFAFRADVVPPVPKKGISASVPTPAAAAPSAVPAGLAKAVPSLLEEMALMPPERLVSAPVARPVSKIITLSPLLEGDETIGPLAARRPPPVVTLLEIANVNQREMATKDAAGGADMDAVLTALEKALAKEWTPPPVQQIPALQRNLRLKIGIGRDGTVVEASVTHPSGSALMDAAVQDAAARVKKISESLPSSFPKDRYNVEVNFHIE